MTVASDLSAQRCPRSMLFAQIEGLEPILCERVDSPPSAAWSTRSLLPCLRPPDEEFSQGLNLGTMTVTPSAQTFELDDIADPTDATRSYFARLFASGRWSQSDVARSNLYPSPWGGARQCVGAAATAIDVFSTSDFDAAGEAHIGQETFGYTSRAGRTFSGCSRGRYPAVGSELGGTYRIPIDGGADDWLEVTEVPYSWLGRMIALYIVTYDELTEAWNAYADAKLLWVGRFTDRGRFVPERAGWQLVAEHISKDLDRDVAVDLPCAPLKHVNLSGLLGRTFTAEATWIDNGMHYVVSYITIAAGFYKDYLSVLKAIGVALNASTVAAYLKFSAVTGEMRVQNTSTQFSVRFVMIGHDISSANRVPSYALHACGFPLGGDICDVTIEPTATVHVETPEIGFLAYHPLGVDVNGARLVCDGAVSSLWSDQGDYDRTRAYVAIRKATRGEEEITYLAAYNGFFVSGSASGFGWASANQAGGIELEIDSRIAVGGGWAGQRYTKSPCLVEQIWKPVQLTSTGQWRGPFEMILYSILSTGTPGTNHALYDALPLSLSLGVPSAIVDTAGFLEADKLIAGSALAERGLYVIGEPTSVAEMLKRECKLFGFFLAWDRGKLRLRNLRRNTFDTWTETLADKDKADASEWPAPEWSNDTVINCWKCKVDFDLNTGKYGPEIVVRNMRSRSALRLTKSVTIEHPGILVEDQSAAVLELLEGELLAGADYLSFPVDVVNVSLTHTRLLRLAIGDVVLYTSSLQYDPFGSGLLSTSCHALVVDLAWKFASRRGRATLLMLSRYAASDKPPWGAAAMVDITAANGGWDPVTKQLTLLPHYVGDALIDSKDGYAFRDGYKVAIVQSSYTPAPAPAPWPLMFSPLVVASTFETDGPNILTLESGPGANWDPELEYCVIYAGLDDVTQEQGHEGLYLGDPNTYKISSSIFAPKWGG